MLAAMASRRQTERDDYRAAVPDCRSVILAFFPVIPAKARIHKLTNSLAALNQA